MTVAYVCAKPDKYMELLKLRNQVHSIVDTDHLYRKKKPHITLVPSFKIKEGSKDRIKDIVSSYSLEGTKLRVERLSAYKTIDRPYVIRLNIDMPICDDIVSLRDELSPHSSVPLSTVDEYHITLVKTRGYWKTVSDDISNRIQREIENQSFPRELEVKNTKVTFRT